MERKRRRPYSLYRGGAKADQLVAHLRREDGVASEGESHVFAALVGVERGHRHGRRVDKPSPQLLGGVLGVRTTVDFW